MTTLTVNIDNKKSEKKITDLLDEMGVSYNINSSTDSLTNSPSSRISAHSFLGRISKADIELMEKAIEEGCEQINPDDWK